MADVTVGSIVQLTTTPQTFEEWYRKHAHGKLGIDWLTVGSYKEMWESATKERDEKLAALQLEVTALRKKLEEAGTENERLRELLYGARCVYCGEVIGKDRKSQDIADELLRAHVLACPQHPVSALRAELARVKGESVRVDVLSRWFDSALERTRQSSPVGSVVDYERVGSWLWGILYERRARRLRA